MGFARRRRRVVRGDYRGPSSARPFASSDVETWLFFDRENPSSVVSPGSRRRGRTGGRFGRLTTEMWDALNGAYLDSRELERRPRSGALLPQLCDWTKRQGALLRGATEGTTPATTAMIS